MVINICIHTTFDQQPLTLTAQPRNASIWHAWSKHWLAFASKLCVLAFPLLTCVCARVRRLFISSSPNMKRDANDGGGGFIKAERDARSEKSRPTHWTCPQHGQEKTDNGLHAFHCKTTYAHLVMRGSKREHCCVLRNVYIGAWLEQHAEARETWVYKTSPATGRACATKAVFPSQEILRSQTRASDDMILHRVSAFLTPETRSS